MRSCSTATVCNPTRTTGSTRCSRCRGARLARTPARRARRRCGRRAAPRRAPRSTRARRPPPRPSRPARRRRPPRRSGRARHRVGGSRRSPRAPCRAPPDPRRSADREVGAIEEPAEPPEELGSSAPTVRWRPSAVAYMRWQASPPVRSRGTGSPPRRCATRSCERCVMETRRPPGPVRSRSSSRCEDLRHGAERSCGEVRDLERWQPRCRVLEDAGPAEVVDVVPRSQAMPMVVAETGDRAVDGHLGTCSGPCRAVRRRRGESPRGRRRPASRGPREAASAGSSQTTDSLRARSAVSIPPPWVASDPRPAARRARHGRRGARARGSRTRPGDTA